MSQQFGKLHLLLSWGIYRTKLWRCVLYLFVYFLIIFHTAFLPCNLFFQLLVYHEILPILKWLMWNCCAQCPLTLVYLQQRTIVIVVPVKTKETVPISQIPTNVLVIQDLLGKTVKVSCNEYSNNVSTLVLNFLHFFLVSSNCSSSKFIEKDHCLDLILLT